MKIPQQMQLDLNIVPTRMYWKKFSTNHGEFVLLFVCTPVGEWCFWMNPPMVTALKEGMTEMESPITIAKVLPLGPPGNGERVT